MADQYQAQLTVGRQEDGLWRVEVPGLHGCWVDAPTLAQAVAEIQEVIHGDRTHQRRGLATAAERDGPNNRTKRRLSLLREL